MSEQVIFEGRHGTIVRREDGTLKVSKECGLYWLACEVAESLDAHAKQFNLLADKAREAHEALAAERAAREAAEARAERLKKLLAHQWDRDERGACDLEIEAATLREQLATVTAERDEASEEAAFFRAELTMQAERLMPELQDAELRVSEANQKATAAAKDHQRTLDELAAVTAGDLGEALGELDMLRGVHAAALADVSRLTAERDEARRMRDAHDKQASDLFMACHEKNQQLAARDAEPAKLRERCESLESLVDAMAKKEAAALTESEAK